MWLWLWLALGVAIAFNLWSAFGKNGHIQTVSADDGNGPPRRFGMEVVGDDERR